jgi:hypothetical protein
MSLVTRHTSPSTHVTRHTSLVTRHTSHSSGHTLELQQQAALQLLMDQPPPAPSAPPAAHVSPPLGPPAELHPAAAASDRGGSTAAVADASEAALQTQAFDDFSSMQRLPPHTSSTPFVAIKVINHSRRVKVFANVYSSKSSSAATCGTSAWSW